MEVLLLRFCRTSLLHGPSLKRQCLNGDVVPTLFLCLFHTLYISTAYFWMFRDPSFLLQT